MGSIGSLLPSLRALRGLPPLATVLVLTTCGPAPDEAGAPTATVAAPSAEGLLNAAPPLDIYDLDSVAVDAIHAAAAQVDETPERAGAWNALAMQLHAYSRLEPAHLCYREALRRAPEDARATYRQALVADALGRTDEGLALLERAAVLDPGYPPAHWRLGLARLERGELERAEADMRAALAGAPSDAAASVGLARVQLALGRNQEAASVLEGHLGRHPEDANARFLLGTAYRGLGRSEEAARALEAGTGGDPLQEDPWLAEVLSLRQGYRSDFLAAMELLSDGEIERATARLEDLHRREPRDTLIHINLHRAYRMAGQLDRALKLLEEARAIDPNQDIVHLHLAGVLREKARGGGPDLDRSLLVLALESAEEACRLSPTFAAASGMRGDILSDLERRDEAAQAWSDAARLDQTDLRWQEKAGRALCLLNRWAEAAPFLEQWNVLQGDTRAALLLWSAALANSGDIEAARVPMERLRRVAPDDPVVEDAWQKLEAERRASAGR